MDSRSSLAVLILLAIICLSHEISPPKKPIPTFHDGYTVTMKLSSASMKGESSILAVIDPNSTITVNVDPSSVQNATFLIFQVHSYIKPLVLSLAPALIYGGHVNGTDVGLYSKLDKKIITYYIVNPNSEPVSLLLVPMLYGSEDPVPGGCNLSFSVSIAPFMTLTYQLDNEIVQVDAQAASIQGQPDCKPLGLTYEVYELQIPDTSADAYFDGIIEMLTPENAEWRGRQTRKPIHQPELRRRFASYPGFGAVYVVTVRNTLTGKSAAYVPIAKYGCIEGNDGDCYTYVGSVWVLGICAVIFVMAEIRYFMGGNMRLLMRSVYTLGTIITFEPALPAALRWPVVDFLSLAFVVLCIVGQLGQALSVFTEHAFALVPAHIYFGMSLYAGLAMISGFQDWLVVLYSFGIYFLLFYIFGRLFPDNGTLDSFFGIFYNVALISALTNRMVFYIYVDPSRILRQEFSDVIFSPPVSLADNLMLVSLPLLMSAYVFARKTFDRRNVVREYQEIPSPPPPPYSPHADYRSI